MKKLFVVFLAVLMLCSVAYAATWADGLSPQKPYSGTPEVDFNETIGYMMFFPVNGSNVDVRVDTLTIYMPREDVNIAEGTLYLYRNGDDLAEEIAISADTVVVRPMLEEELDALMWGCGTAFDFKLANPLEINSKYLVQVTEGAIVSSEYEAVSPAIAGEDAWVFDTITANYIENLTYNRMVEGSDAPATVDSVVVGDYASFDIVIGEDAAYAVVFSNAGLIVPEANYFEANATTTVNFPANGTVDWGVAFFDAEDNLVYIHSVITEVKAAE